jgi:hypothetical protein
MTAGPECFTETAVLYAVMNEDPDRARELIAGMTRSELHGLYGQLCQTLDLTTARLRETAPEGIVL